MVRRASFGKENASLQDMHVANWIVGCGDNQGVPFTIIDKVNAKGKLQRAAPAMLGLVTLPRFRARHRPVQARVFALVNALLQRAVSSRLGIGM